MRYRFIRFGGTNKLITSIPEHKRSADDNIWFKVCLNTLLFPSDKFKYFVYVRSGKGGKKRLVPVIGNEKTQESIVE